MYVAKNLAVVVISKTYYARVGDKRHRHEKYEADRKRKPPIEKQKKGETDARRLCRIFKTMYPNKPTRKTKLTARVQHNRTSQ